MVLGRFALAICWFFLVKKIALPETKPRDIKGWKMRPIFIGVVVVSGSLNATMLSMVVGSFFGLKKLQCGRYWVIFSRDPANKNPTEVFFLPSRLQHAAARCFPFFGTFWWIGEFIVTKTEEALENSLFIMYIIRLLPKCPSGNRGD